MAEPLSSTMPASPPNAAEYRRLADDVEANLKTHVLANWFPRSIDTKGGGFFQNFNEDWSLGADASRGIVYQSRLTWTAAQAARRYSQQADFYGSATKHGLDFLANRLWDQQNGGFFWSVDVAGKPDGRDGSSKQAYGNSFGIYAASTVYAVNHDPAALRLAQDAFRWYDAHGYDNVNGGYFERLTPEGKPDLQSSAMVGGGANIKSMNTTIHFVEALTALYCVWPDPLVKARLQEMFEILRDKIVAEPGYLIQYFSVDWKPGPGDDSYGHDVETAFLLTEAAAALGQPDDAKSWSDAKMLVDHATAVAWDSDNGGLYESGDITVGGRHPPRREWWVQAEYLNALLLLHEHFGKDNSIYWTTFLAQWKWIHQCGLDTQHTGWWPRVNNDGSPVHGAKSDAWTECYHQGRAMMSVHDRLVSLAEKAGN